MKAILKTKFKYYIFSDENLVPPKSKNRPMIVGVPTWLPKEIIKWNGDSVDYEADCYEPKNKWMVDNDGFEWVEIEPGDIIVNNDGGLGQIEFGQNTKSIIKGAFGELSYVILSADKFKKYFSCCK